MFMGSASFQSFHIFLYFPTHEKKLLKIILQYAVHLSFLWENLLRAFDRVNDVTICSLRHVIGYKGEL